MDITNMIELKNKLEKLLIDLEEKKKDLQEYIKNMDIQINSIHYQLYTIHNHLKKDVNNVSNSSHLEKQNNKNKLGYGMTNEYAYSGDEYSDDSDEEDNYYDNIIFAQMNINK